MHQEQADNNWNELERSDKIEEIMASHLPPRSEYHNKIKKSPQKRNSDKNKGAKYPLIRVLAFLFILLPIIVASYYYYNELFHKPVYFEEVDTGFEQVEIEKPNE